MKIRNQGILIKPGFFLILIIFLGTHSFTTEFEDKIKEARNFISTDSDTAHIILYQLYNKAEKSNSKWELAIASEAMGEYYAEKEEYRTAIKFYKKSLSNFDLLDSIQATINIHLEIGLMNYWLGEYEKSTSSYMKGIALSEKYGDITAHARYCQNMGMLYSEISNIDLALKYYNKALDLSVDRPELQSNRAGILQNIGIIYSGKEELDRAIEYYKQALDIYNNLEETVNMAIIYNNLGVVFERLKNFDSTLIYYKKSLDIFYEIDFKRGISISMSNIGQIYQQKNDNKKALECLFKSLEVAEEIELNYQIQSIYRQLSYIYERENNYKNALNYMILAYNSKDSIYNIEKSKQITELEKIYETEKKEQQIVIQQAKLRSKTIRNNALSIISFLGLGVTILIYLNLNNKKKSNLKLETKNELLDNKNKQITSSITYASFIQSAILPPLSIFEEAFPESFILFKPKAIVSGDFYWITKTNNKVIFAIADCTGHGVPGALMSMLGISFLNEIINIYKEYSTDKILNALRDRIISALRQKDNFTDTRDGMEIALCSIDLDTYIMEFCGSYLPLYVVSKNNLLKLEANRMPIGYNKIKNGSFESQTLQLSEDDLIYIYTDGFTDQFGGERRKKFSRARLNDLLISNYLLKLEDQKVYYEKTLEEWMNGNEQIDDITLLGIKI